MQLYFIRHAQSENNALWDRTGSSKGRSTDPLLTETGYQQASLLADFLQQTQEFSRINGRDPRLLPFYRPTHLYCSLMARSVTTGVIVAERLGLPLIGWKDLHESGGIYQEEDETGELLGLPGRTRSQFEEQYPTLVLPPEVTEAGWWNRPFEAREERTPRGRRVLSDLLKCHGGTDDQVAIISHGGFYNHFLTAVFGLPEQIGVWFYLNNVSITRIDFTDTEVSAVFHNRTDALPDHLLT